MLTCTATTGGTSFDSPTYALYCGSSTDGSTAIEGLVLHGGGVVAYTSGIRCVGSQDIRFNSIHGGDSASSTAHYGIFVGGGSPTIRGNYVYGGDNAADQNIGLELRSSSVVEGNIISGGVGAQHLHGIGCFGTSKIRNNLIFAGTAPRMSAGIYAYGAGANPEVVNNTICGGIDGAGSDCIRLLSGAQAAIKNNILFTTAVGSRSGIKENDDTCDPVACLNNDIFDCPVLYRDRDGAVSNLTDIADVNALSDITSGGNVSIDLIGPVDYFLDVDGPDDDITTMLDNDWRLTDDCPVEVRGGGLDLSADFSEDITGAARTSGSPTGMSNDGAAGWSMGAYEWR
ncbi:MAG: right-handed parallel beta-helix repeat-containing protein [Spirochaetales bacterium]|nr:right-handed parallel beta-helix repeat-containing protein [Spirochaetales bacterium]